MSSNKHTEGKLRWDTQGDHKETLNIYNESGEILIQRHILYSSEREKIEADSARLVECWNHFDDLKENLARIIDRIEEGGFQLNFPSAYTRAKEALDKLSK